MAIKWGDPKLDALDVVRAALGRIYDAKRARTTTAKDDVRLKELHVEWMAIMRKLGDERACNEGWDGSASATFSALKSQALDL
jgi:hypothetical protein